MTNLKFLILRNKTNCFWYWKWGKSFLCKCRI